MKRIEEMISELEGYRWDATLMSETWRSEKSEIWETHHKHIFTGAGKYDNKHGVGIVLNKKWRQKIIDTEYISERAITAAIVVNHQRIKLMSVYFSHYADQHVEKCIKRSSSTRQIAKTTYRLLEETSMLNWDLAAEPNVQVLADTHSTKETKEVTG